MSVCAICGGMHGMSCRPSPEAMTELTIETMRERLEEARRHPVKRSTLRSEERMRRGLAAILRNIVLLTVGYSNHWNRWDEFVFYRIIYPLNAWANARRSEQ